MGVHFRPGHLPQLSSFCLRRSATHFRSDRDLLGSRLFDRVKKKKQSQIVWAWTHAAANKLKPQQTMSDVLETSSRVLFKTKRSRVDRSKSSCWNVVHSSAPCLGRPGRRRCTENGSPRSSGRSAWQTQMKSPPALQLCSHYTHHRLIEWIYERRRFWRCCSRQRNFEL